MHPHFGGWQDFWENDRHDRKCDSMHRKTVLDIKQICVCEQYRVTEQSISLLSHSVTNKLCLQLKVMFWHALTSGVCVFWPETNRAGDWLTIHILYGYSGEKNNVLCRDYLIFSYIKQLLLHLLKKFSLQRCKENFQTNCWMHALQKHRHISA